MLSKKRYCFDEKKYIKEQSKRINERLKKFDNKLYMEFGGKLFDDLHASRVLPGFSPNVQLQILEDFKDKCEILIVINANDIEKNKVRADFDITYDMEVVRLIQKFRQRNLLVSGIVITLFEDQPSAIKFKDKMVELGEKVYIHYFTKGYPTDIEMIVSEQGYGKNPYIPTTKPLVIITAPGPGSGKLATCLSQLYHEYKKGTKAGYAKFEKFPVWNLPLKHPINIAYEASTADLKDYNLVDSYHLEEYKKIAITYNRDFEIFPVVKNILKKISNKEIYKSPTDMGINTIADCIIDDKLARESAKQEIIRRYLRAKVEYKKGKGKKSTIERIKLLMNEVNTDVYDRKCVYKAEEKSKISKQPAMAIELNDGQIVTGRQTNLLTAPSSAILNALKTICKIDDKIDLISLEVIKPIIQLKSNVFNLDNNRLTLKEMLVALSISSIYNKNSKLAYENLIKLRDCNAHSTHILTTNNEQTIRNLGINLTCGDKILNRDIFEL